VKPADKIRKEAAEMSLSDFHPKRFALSYDPPVIGKLIISLIMILSVLEYLVPSTGKLYHHKMRLKNFTSESNVDEVMEYLEKRHPLYFMNKKFEKG
jgi:hypothetical protein